MADKQINISIIAKETLSAVMGDATSALSRMKSALGTLQASATMALGWLQTGWNAVIAPAMEAERAMAQTNAVIKSTGGAAGMTAEQVADLAASESRLSSIDDEVIQGGENMLLTFTNIGGDVFPRATRTM